MKKLLTFLLSLAIASTFTAPTSASGSADVTVNMAAGITKASWPWVHRATEIQGDAPSSPVDLDILGDRVRMDTQRLLTFYVDFSSAQSLGQLAASGAELRFSFDTNGDNSEDFFVSTGSFTSEGMIDGALRDAVTGTNVSGCSVSMRVIDKTIYTALNASCFSNATSLNFRFQTVNVGAVVDSSPDAGWYVSSLSLLDVFVCSKDQKGKSFDEAGVRYFCVLASGTLSKGSWKLTPESQVTDTNYLKMYVCSSAQKGNVVKIDRSTGIRLYTCAKVNGKWKHLSAAEAQAAADKAAKAAAAAAAAKAAADRARKVASARYSTHKAYFHCKLDSKDKKIFVEVADGGRTLIMDSVGLFRYSRFGVQYEDYQCVANYLKMPRSLQSKVGNTRALDGTLEGKWGSLSAFWNYHPDSGMNITFTLVK